MTTTCRWYALCDNETSTALSHPILGLVPCCERCAAKHDVVADLVPLEA